MSHSAAIFAALGPLVGGRCYPVVFPQEPLPTWPAIRYTPTGGATYPSSCGDSDADDQTVQVHAVAETYSEAETLERAVRIALTQALPCTTDGAASFDYDSDTKTHRAVLLFTIQPTSD